MLYLNNNIVIQFILYILYSIYYILYALHILYIIYHTLLNILTKYHFIIKHLFIERIRLSSRGYFNVEYATAAIMTSRLTPAIAITNLGLYLSSLSIAECFPSSVVVPADPHVQVGIGYIYSGV